MDVTVPDRMSTVTARLAQDSFAADPDLAASSLQRLLDAAQDRQDLAAAIAGDPGFRDRLTAVLGASPALGEHLARHPDQWRSLAAEVTTASRPTRLGLHET